jgi:hypothetical protein
MKNRSFRERMGFALAGWAISFAALAVAGAMLVDTLPRRLAEIGF